MVITLLSYGVVLAFWVLAILWCALRYARSPARIGSSAALFATMLATALFWPLARMGVHDFGLQSGLTSEVMSGVIGVAEIGLIMVVPTLAIVAITTSTPDP
jgi:hypothetical protein